MEDHYLRCDKTEIECGQCQQRIAGRHWKIHLVNCPRKIVQCCFCVAAFPQIDIQPHQALCAENPERITSSNARKFYRSNTSASPLSAERGNTSVYASTDNGELHEPCDMATEVDDAGRNLWSLNVGHLQGRILTFIAAAESFPLASFIHRNTFARYFGLPLFALLCVSLLVRRRNQ